MKLIYDDEGHPWVVTDYWCAICGMPLHESQADYGTHPNCGGDS